MEFKSERAKQWLLVKYDLSDNLLCQLCKKPTVKKLLAILCQHS